MSDHKKRKFPLVPILAVLAAIPVLLFVAYIALVFTFGTVSGSATLPSGVVLDISGGWGFGASSGPKLTTVDIAGRQFEFTKTVASVDGIEFMKLDGTENEMILKVDGGELMLFKNGQLIDLP